MVKDFFLLQGAPVKRQVIAQPMSAEDFERRKEEGKKRLDEQVRGCCVTLK